MTLEEVRANLRKICKEHEEKSKSYWAIAEEEHEKIMELYLNKDVTGKEWDEQMCGLERRFARAERETHRHENIARGIGIALYELFKMEEI